MDYLNTLVPIEYFEVHTFKYLISIKALKVEGVGDCSFGV